VSYKTIIFDLGKVIFDYSWDHMYKYFSRLADISPGEVKAKMAVNSDPIFLDFERGLVTTTDYMKHVEQLLGIRLSISQFAEGLNSIYEESYEGIEEILGQLELNYLLVALTNTNPVHTTEWRRRYADQLIYFSYIFCSHEMQSRKPEPLIYEQVIRSVGTMPHECVFFDDRQDNVEGAKRVGMAAIRVTSPLEIRKALAKLGLTT